MHYGYSTRFSSTCVSVVSVAVTSVTRTSVLWPLKRFDMHYFYCYKCIRIHIKFKYLNTVREECERQRVIAYVRDRIKLIKHSSDLICAFALGLVRSRFLRLRLDFFPPSLSHSFSIQLALQWLLGIVTIYYDELILVFNHKNVTHTA